MKAVQVYLTCIFIHLMVYANTYTRNYSSLPNQTFSQTNRGCPQFDQHDQSARRPRLRELENFAWMLDEAPRLRPAMLSGLLERA